MFVDIDHIAIAARSVEQAVSFYQSLGMALEAEAEVPHEKVRIAFLACGATKLELVAPSGAESPLDGFLAKHGPGLRHSLRSTDRGADDARLRSAGCPLVRAEPTDAGDGFLTQFTHPRASGGVLIELQQALTQRCDR